MQRRDAVGVREVARHAGVSIGTVSNVLNRPEKVGKMTRRIVQNAMNELGFVPLRAAGQLRGGSSGLIGVIVPDVGNMYWASVLRGIEATIDAQGLTMIVASTRQSKFRQREQLRSMQSQGVDGLIVAPIAEQKDEWSYFQRKTKFGLILVSAMADKDIASVRTNDLRGAQIGIQHLLDMGHRHIAFINGPHFVPWCLERYQGAYKAIVDSGYENEISFSEVLVEDLTMDEGAQAASRVFDEGIATAIMCANDMLALGVIKAAKEKGIAIPESVSVVGYDDSEFSALVDPPLTTIRQPSFQLGVEAAQLLLQEREQGDIPSVVFEPELIDRLSTSAVG
ncbi:LacI family DNA-binding transcriptional regulator [Trueperella sp. LYQ141]|uniref:LacI family DNA-binding transcriptional regulator n=1 Tax=Trueperella sp. LYQ141 TaxID=3391058 RepID=UPI0039831BA1